MKKAIIYYTILMCSVTGFILCFDKTDTSKVIPEFKPLIKRLQDELEANHNAQTKQLRFYNNSTIHNSYMESHRETEDNKLKELEKKLTEKTDSIITDYFIERIDALCNNDNNLAEQVEIALSETTAKRYPVKVQNVLNKLSAELNTIANCGDTALIWTIRMRTDSAELLLRPALDIKINHIDGNQYNQHGDNKNHENNWFIPKELDTKKDAMQWAIAQGSTKNIQNLLTYAQKRGKSIYDNNLIFLTCWKDISEADVCGRQVAPPHSIRERNKTRYSIIELLLNNGAKITNTAKECIEEQEDQSLINLLTNYQPPQKPIIKIRNKGMSPRSPRTPVNTKKKPIQRPPFSLTNEHSTSDYQPPKNVLYNQYNTSQDPQVKLLGNYIF